MNPAHLATSAGLIVLLSLAVTGCGQAPPEAPPAPTVTVSYPVEREVTDYASFTARTAAVDSVEMRARVGGYLEKVNFKEGALVKKGEVLFEIDPRPYQALVENSVGQVALNEATVKKAKADNARYKALATKSPEVVTQQDLDLYQAEEDRAIANLKTSKAALETNQLNLGFTKVTSPIDGRVSRYYVTVGNLIAQDQTLLTTIVSVDPMYAYFDVDEPTVLRVRQMIREGKAKSARDAEIAVHLGLENEVGHPHRGTINFVDNQIDPKTGTLRLRGVFANKDEVLSPGHFARVRVPIGFPHQSLLVTDRAIDNDQGQKILYVINDENEVVSRPIRTGALHDGLRAIDQGLKPRERVVVNALQQVRPGITVEATLVDMPVSASARKSDMIKSIAGE